MLRHEVVGALSRPVEDGDPRSMRGQVARKVHAHRRKADHPDLLLAHEDLVG